MFFKSQQKKFIILVLTICLLVMPTLQSKKAEAASFGQQLLYGAAAITLITTYYNNVNDHGQNKVLADTQKQTGVYNNAAATQRISSIEHQLKAPGLIKADYAIYANPKKDFNAFCTLGHVISINKGALDTLDDDELASIMAHEMCHGEKKHVVRGITKSVSLGVAVELFLADNQNNTSYVLSAIGANYINNEMFTMQQEWEADNNGFQYIIAADFNPGGPAAAMIKLRSQYGELHHEGLAKIINPNNHPKTSDRINNFSAKLTAYSHNHIRVKDDKTVLIDDKPVITPVKTNQYLAEERAYLIAGNLAKVYHNNSLTTATIGDDGAVYVGNQMIATPTANDITPVELCNTLNSIIGENI